MKEFSKAAGSRCTKISSIARHLQLTIKKTVSFTIAPTKIKYSGISLTKKCKIETLKTTGQCWKKLEEI